MQPIIQATARWIQIKSKSSIAAASDVRATASRDNAITSSLRFRSHPKLHATCIEDHWKVVVGFPGLPHVNCAMSTFLLKPIQPWVFKTWKEPYQSHVPQAMLTLLSQATASIALAKFQVPVSRSMKLRSSCICLASFIYWVLCFTCLRDCPKAKTFRIHKEFLLLSSNACSPWRNMDFHCTSECFWHVPSVSVQQWACAQARCHAFITCSPGATHWG